MADKYSVVQRSKIIKRPFEELDIAAKSISVEIGSVIVNHAKCLIRINGETLLAITPPSRETFFPTVNGTFYDINSIEICRITDNAWEGISDAWDTTLTGRNLTIKTSQGQIALSFRVDPPNRVSITAINMYLDDCHILTRDGELYIGRVRDEKYVYFGVGRIEMNGPEYAIDIDTRSESFQYQGIAITGGEGIEIRGTGIQLGVKSGAMVMRDLKVWQG